MSCIHFCKASLTNFVFPFSCNASPKILLIFLCWFLCYGTTLEIDRVVQKLKK
ncbi:hypothetical protein SLEP1_g6779 [Rubroshorea leprosula]|uniref:Uncharacterized protein n=1 Tax=Rubroshorea leprosula TaxID=152421 RepID=A0AAV5I2A1_9ROSI|nr:hypothetical protein SLEP1_g6779 [Rubroshorea leprosula]